MRSITDFIVGINPYFIGFTVLLGIGCAFITMEEAKTGRQGSIVFVPFACAGCVISALQTPSLALLYMVISAFLGLAWIITNIRVHRYYEELASDYSRIKYEHDRDAKELKQLLAHMASKNSQEDG